MIERGQAHILKYCLARGTADPLHLLFQSVNMNTATIAIGYTIVFSYENSLLNQHIISIIYIYIVAYITTQSISVYPRSSLSAWHLVTTNSKNLVACKFDIIISIPTVVVPQESTQLARAYIYNY